MIGYLLDSKKPVNTRYVNYSTLLSVYIMLFQYSGQQELSIEMINEVGRTKSIIKSLYTV